MKRPGACALTMACIDAFVGRADTCRHAVGVATYSSQFMLSFSRLFAHTCLPRLPRSRGRRE
jgi:hypothetical protein